ATSSRRSRCPVSHHGPSSTTALAQLISSCPNNGTVVAATHTRGLMERKPVPPADRGVRVEVPEEVQPLPVDDATAGDEGVDDNPSVQRRSDVEGDVDDDQSKR